MTQVSTRVNKKNPGGLSVKKEEASGEGEEKKDREKKERKKEKKEKERQVVKRRGKDKGGERRGERSPQSPLSHQESKENHSVVASSKKRQPPD